MYHFILNWGICNVTNLFLPEKTVFIPICTKLVQIGIGLHFFSFQICDVQKKFRERYLSKTKYFITKFLQDEKIRSKSDGKSEWRS